MRLAGILPRCTKHPLKLHEKMFFYYSVSRHLLMEEKA